MNTTTFNNLYVDISGESFIRDIGSKALVNTDKDALVKNREIRKMKKSSQEFQECTMEIKNTVIHLLQEVSELKKESREIKRLLSHLVLKQEGQEINGNSNS